MASKPPNRFIAPSVIAGITIGFLVAGYKFVSAGQKNKPTAKQYNDQSQQAQDQATKDNQPE
jgi:hypothetical protein